MNSPRDDEEIRPDEPVVVRDRRKVDPETGELRQESVEEEMSAGEVSSPADDSEDGDTVEVLGAEPADSTAAPGQPTDTAAESPVEAELAQRTADLQRLQAEYANYRKRVERDRETERIAAQASVVEQLLPILDDLGRAEAHGDLTGAFKAVADKLTSALGNSGLAAFGAEGDTFDPNVHEAVQHETSPEVSGPTVTTVLRQGYSLGDRVLRNAMVAVTDHEAGATDPADPAGETPSQQTMEAPIDPPAEGELPVDGEPRE